MYKFFNVSFTSAIPSGILFYLSSADMRRDVQEIFKMTPHDKQVMMFSATLSKEIRPVCKKFMQDVMFHGQILLEFRSIFFINAQLSPRVL